MTVHITIEDHDDRPEQMVRDPERYFADARHRAEQELMHQARWLFQSQRHPKAALRPEPPGTAVNHGQAGPVTVGPDYTLGACPGCTGLADALDGTLVHLNHRDVTLICLSRAPIERLTAYKQRMGWQFPYVSTCGTDFAFDFGLAMTEQQAQQIPEVTQMTDNPPGWLQERRRCTRASSRQQWHSLRCLLRFRRRTLYRLRRTDRRPAGRPARAPYAHAHSGRPAATGADCLSRFPADERQVAQVIAVMFPSIEL